MSIVKRIKREARNNPAKAAVLVGLLGLAIYFWAPLIWGWLDAGERSPRVSSRSEAEIEQPSRSDTKPSASDEKADEQKKASWKELQEWRTASPWTEAANLADLGDPFRATLPEATVAEVSEETEEPPTAAPEQMVASVDLQLTGTIVSPKRRVALLNGRAYREGDMISVEYLGTTWELEIRQIDANRVTLGWESIERELTTPERQTVGRIELVGRSQPRN